MAARRSKIRQDFVVKRILLTSAILTATSSARFIGRRLPEATTEEGEAAIDRANANAPHARAEGLWADDNPSNNRKKRRGLN